MLTRAQVKKILKQDTFHEVPVRKKITLEELRKNTRFDNLGGFFKGPEYEGKTNKEIIRMAWQKMFDKKRH